jgi:hypothetical protein
LTADNVVLFPSPHKPALALDRPWPKLETFEAYKALLDNIALVVIRARMLMSATKPELRHALDDLEQHGELDQMFTAFDRARDDLACFVDLIDVALCRIEHTRPLG